MIQLMLSGAEMPINEIPLLSLPRLVTSVVMFGDHICSFMVGLDNYLQICLCSLDEDFDQPFLPLNIMST